MDAGVKIKAPGGRHQHRHGQRVRHRPLRAADRHHRRGGLPRRHGLQGRRHVSEGITGIQLDMKARGIPQDRIVLPSWSRPAGPAVHPGRRWPRSSSRARPALSTLSPRGCSRSRSTRRRSARSSDQAARPSTRIQDETGATIDIEEDGTIFISCDRRCKGAEAARNARSKALTDRGRRWAEILRGQGRLGQGLRSLHRNPPRPLTGFCHVSELDNEVTSRTSTDVVNVGDAVRACQGHQRSTTRAASRSPVKAALREQLE